MVGCLLFFAVYVLSVLSSCGWAGLPGHMQPLGSHREPELVPRVSPEISPVEFHRSYVADRKAVILDQVLVRTGIVEKWGSDDYLREHYGSEEVTVEEQKKENRSGPSTTADMSSFLERYNSSNVYLVSTLPQRMSGEWPVPRQLLCGGYTRHLAHVYMWMSSGGTRSVLHSDNIENLHCLVSGRKDFVIIDPKYSALIGPEHQRLGYYQGLDVQKVDMLSYPGLAQVPWLLASVYPGDCLYLPFDWLHHVRSYGRNLGVNVWWHPFHFDEEDCMMSKELPDFASLADFSLVPELSLRTYLYSCTREDGSIHAADFYDKLQFYDGPHLTMEQVIQVFDMLFPGSNGTLHKHQLDGPDAIIPVARYIAVYRYVERLTEEQRRESWDSSDIDIGGDQEGGPVPPMGGAGGGARVVGTEWGAGEEQGVDPVPSPSAPGDDDGEFGGYGFGSDDEQSHEAMYEFDEGAGEPPRVWKDEL